MSRETEQLFKELQKHLDGINTEERTQEEVEAMIRDFFEKQQGKPLPKITPETASTSDDFLELAYGAGNQKERIRFAKQALKLDPHNFDAEILLLEVKDQDETRNVRDFGKAVERATRYMEQEGYFDEEYIGEFWGVLETRPYMRLRSCYLDALLDCGMIGLACKEAEELLRLCENDNLGIRYRLMHIYTYFEEEEKALALHKQFDGYPETQMLFPLAILYYKRNELPKAAQYLRKLNGANKDLKRFLKFELGELPELEKELPNPADMEGYRRGSLEELLLEQADNYFLFQGLDAFLDWALEQLE